MSEVDQIARFYLFIKWLKANHKEYFILYGIHITVPDEDLKIKVDMNYIDPAHKQQMQGIINEFNMRVYD